MFGITFKELLTNTRLNERDLLSLLGIEKTNDELLSAEVSIEQLEQIATRLGLEMEALFEPQRAASPLTLLFREHRDRGNLLANLRDEDRLALGKFTQIARRLSRLEASLGQQERASNRLRALQRSIALVEGREIEEAESQAERIRAALHLGQEPIGSMRKLLAELDVTVVTSTIEEMDRELDGASLLLDGRGFILINPSHHGARWWRNRMTLAHELGHLLMDQAQLTGTQKTNFLLVTPYQRDHETSLHKQRERFDHLESRANAFAAALLVPSAGLSDLVGAREPSEPAVISEVMRHFSVGLQTAVNRLQNVFGLSYEARARMLRYELQGVLPTRHPDTFSRAEIGMYRGPLLKLVQRALLDDEIDRTEALKLLDLKLVDPIPAPRGREQDPRFAPLISSAEVQRRMRLKGTPDATQR